MNLDIPVNQLSRFRVHCHCTGAIDDTSRDNCLGIDTRQRLGGFIGQDGSFGGHYAVLSQSHKGTVREKEVKGGEIIDVYRYQGLTEEMACFKALALAG